MDVVVPPGGIVTALGFAVLAVATATSAVLGWRAAVQRRFAEHRLWMLRCFALLCSAVVLRVIGGLTESFGLEGTYPYAAWLSWLAPLVAFEGSRLIRRPVRVRRS